MYAGTTIRHGSGRIVGVHQKIDRAARRYLKHYLKNHDYFPGIKSILHFEGNNGPDGLKRKNPAIDKTWYFINPEKNDEYELLVIINNHMFNLAEALRSKDEVKAAFEAAWLAHAVVDALTPAHHYPLGEKIEELWGKAYHERSSIFEKNIVPGDNLKDKLLKNWEYWNIKGVFTLHGLFEFGVATAISTENFRDISVERRDLTRVKREGFNDIFFESLRKVDSWGMYDELAETGWTKRLAKRAKKELVPEMIRMVIIAWYKATAMSKEACSES